MKRKPARKLKYAALLSLLSLPFVMPSCIRSVETSEAMTESEIIQLQSNCGDTRTFLFAHVQPTLKGQSKKDWACWYAAKSNRVYGQPSQEEMKAMFSQAKPVVWKYINSNTLTSRLAEIDRQRTAVMWLGTGLALLGCGVLAVGSGGLALAACTLLGSAPAAYDVLGGDPTLGSGEAWRKMAEMSDSEIMKMECNATSTIMEQARLIDRRVLPKAEGSSTTSCPSIRTLMKEGQSIVGVQAGPEEVKKRNSSVPSKPTPNQ
ncbi:MAG: hypothetical protein FJY29_01740 [Betaproteobacteria bacterium]|nr:hypothetical protein [Betaproteobacteria bacterium]